MAGETIYHKVLAGEKRRLKDYQEVHFRRGSISTVQYDSDHSNKPSPTRFSVALSSSGSGSGTGIITITPRRTSRVPAQLEGEFTPSTASLHLRQTERLWLYPHLSRQEATKMLFDRPIGTFIVRNSQKAHYAMSLRTPTDDPAVSHFLVEHNQQGFLTIQGSNLPFLTIYDLLAYFCFNKSGGMPCYLAKPVPDSGAKADLAEQDSSESSDSDDDTNEDSFRSRAFDLMMSPPPTSPPPRIPPHQVPMSTPVSIHSRRRHTSHSVRLYPVHEEVCIDAQKQVNYISSMKERHSKLRSPSYSPTSPSPPVQRGKRQPPPKPPRGSSLVEEDVFPPEEAQRVIRKVDSIVDMDVQKLYQNYRKMTLEREDRREGGREGGEGEASPSPLQRRQQLRRRKSWSSENTCDRRHVNSIIELFERRGSLEGLIKGSPPGPFRNRLPACPLRGNSAPILPPRPTRPPHPPRPWQSSSASKNPPVIPPHTPAPLLPPRPVGGKAPFIPSRERSSSDSSFPGKSRPPAPPPVDVALPPMRPTKRSNEPHYEFDLELREKLAAARRKAAEAEREEEEEGRREWMTAQSDPGLDRRVNGISGGSAVPETERELSGSSIMEGSVKGKKKRAWPKKLPKFYRKPRKKIRKFIIDLAGDSSQEFGLMVGEFISDIKAHSQDPYQKMLSEIRTFMTQIHDYLLHHHHTDLVNCGMESCNNFEHVIETSLQQCVLRPLSLYVYLRIEEHLMENTSLFQVQRSVLQGKNRTPQEMGIRENIVVPSDKVVAEIAAIFNRMTKTYCAISKLEFLLEAVRLTYENVRDAKNPKKSMSDLGADDFLPLFVWVLVQAGFTRAEIEAEYMWGLAHPSLFNGEAGYYLTTLTSAINVLKEAQPAVSAFPQEDTDGDNFEEQIQNLPCMNSLQTELKIFFEDASTGQYSSAYRLAVVPDMTVAEVCATIAQKHCKSNPDSYGLFTVVDGRVTEMRPDERPQEVKKRWALERSTAAGNKPQRRFMAYKLKTPKQ